MWEREFFFGLAFLNFVWIIPLALVGLAIPYLVARIRERNGPPDPHVGVKTAHHFFMTTGMFTMLSGFTLICITLMEIDSPRIGRGGMGVPFLDMPIVRVAFALLCVGGLFTLLHGLMLLATNDGQIRTVRRAFTGLRFVVSGLIVFIALAVLLAVVFQKNANFSEVKPVLGVLIVWVPSWFLHMAFLLVGTPRATPASQPPSIENYYDE